MEKGFEGEKKENHKGIGHHEIRFKDAPIKFSYFTFVQSQILTSTLLKAMKDTFCVAWFGQNMLELFGLTDSSVLVINVTEFLFLSTSEDRELSNVIS